MENKAKHKDESSIFIGQHNKKNQPSGFVRLIDGLGHIHEGCFSSDLRLSGFCISFKGDVIDVGWYKNDDRIGNWMQLSGTDLRIIHKGWYVNNVCS